MTNIPKTFDQMDQWKAVMFLYNSALKEINTKIEILNNEFIHIYSYTPIEHIKSRLKTPESIVKKLKHDGREVTIANMIDYLSDIAGIRIICSFTSDIYLIADMIAKQSDVTVLYVKDYIKNPKPNGYQSIHTVVLGPGGKTVEIQIRTKQMHEDAELGVAAHWKYKEGAAAGGARSGHEDRIAWLRKLIAWQEEMADSGEMLDEVRSQVFDDRVYVFTPKGDVVDLPAGSTPLDFAYHIHSDVGHRCIGAKIGGRIVPFTYQLQMGDQIEIIPQKQPNPSRDWLNPNLGYVTTSRGRSKIHAWFRKQDRDKNILAGRQILDDELEHLGISLKEAEKHLLPRYNFNDVDELLAAIGGGDIRLNQMVNFLQSQFNKPSAEEQDAAALKQLQQKSYTPQNRSKDNGRVVVEGVGNLMHHIARCCQPIPGDEIVGFITQGRGISVHRADCEQLAELRSHAPERIVDAVWGESYSAGYSLVVRVEAKMAPATWVAPLTAAFAAGTPWFRSR